MNRILSNFENYFWGTGFKNAWTNSKDSENTVKSKPEITCQKYVIKTTISKNFELWTLVINEQNLMWIKNFDRPEWKRNESKSMHLRRLTFEKFSFSNCMYYIIIYRCRQRTDKFKFRRLVRQVMLNFDMQLFIISSWKHFKNIIKNLFELSEKFGVLMLR